MLGDAGRRPGGRRRRGDGKVEKPERNIRLSFRNERVDEWMLRKFGYLHASLFRMEGDHSLGTSAHSCLPGTSLFQKLQFITARIEGYLSSLVVVLLFVIDANGVVVLTSALHTYNFENVGV